jgi:hypothetical protein
MPLGATPSRWCVCQFHHFRATTLNQLLAGHGAQGTESGLLLALSSEPFDGS